MTNGISKKLCIAAIGMGHVAQSEELVKTIALSLITIIAILFQTWLDRRNGKEEK